MPLFTSIHLYYLLRLYSFALMSKRGVGTASDTENLQLEIAVISAKNFDTGFQFNAWLINLCKLNN